MGNEWIEKQVDTYQSFRSEWSPKSRWYHRRPTVSPIVPLIYWNTRESYEGIQDPFGSWGGVPKEVLNRITEEIEKFRGYWESLPKKRGIDNLRWALSNPQRFFSLLHELATAFQFVSKPGIQVEPLFLDAQAVKGKPDILIKTSKKEFAVQCKSEDPSKATQMPYDMFQYFAGIFQRLVEDSNTSYHLTLRLKKNIDLNYTNRIRNRVEKLIKGGLTIPYSWSTSYCDLELTEIRSKSAALSIDQIFRRIKNQRDDPLYQEFVPILDNSTVITNRRGANLFISGRRGKDLEWFIRSVVIKSVNEARTALPLIIAVHLYQDIDFAEFRNRSSIKQQFIPWTDKFFQENQKVAMIFLSSNHELYFPHTVGKNQVGLKFARQGFVIESPEWDHSEVEELGV